MRVGASNRRNFAACSRSLSIGTVLMLSTSSAPPNGTISQGASLNARTIRSQVSPTIASRSIKAMARSGFTAA